MTDTLTALDATFLELEEHGEGALMHTGGVMVFDALPDGGSCVTGSPIGQAAQAGSRDSLIMARRRAFSPSPRIRSSPQTSSSRPTRRSSTRG
jgi:hypothetical protein